MAFVRRVPGSGLLLNVDQVAEFLGRPRSAVFELVEAGAFPAAINAAENRRVWMWSRRLVERWANGVLAVAS